MKVIIVGAGEVGYHIADRLSKEKHDVTVIEKSLEKERLLKTKLNAMVILGSGANVDVLESAGIAQADLFIAVTDLDEVNLVACMLANEYQVPHITARIKSLEYSKPGWQRNAAKLGIDLLINPQNVVADEICNIVAHTAATEAAEFANGRVVFLGYPIGKDSPLAGISLKELGGIRGIYRLVVTAIQRNHETVIPRGADVIERGDTVYFVCNKRDLGAVNYLFGFEKEETKTIFILGAGRVGAAVASRLAALKYRVKVIDRNPQHCADLAQTLDNVLVLNTEGTDVDTLKSEGIADGDVFIGATQDEQTNILCSLLAKSYGVKRGIALVNQPQFVTLAPDLGIDACISPRMATAAAILKYVRRGEVLSMAMVEQSDSEVLELILPADSDVAHRPLRSIHVPRGAIIGAIVRDDKVIIPSGDDHLEPDDHVIVFTLPEAVGRVEKFFS